MIDTSALKSKILFSAMRGQLSERLPEDSSVDSLYEDIIGLKNELKKTKGIRKDVELDETFETEYEIPTEWKWVRFGKIITLQSGQDLKRNEYNACYKGIPYMTGASNFNDDGTLTVNRWTETPKSIAKNGDILISVKGTVGKVAILSEEKVHIARQIMGIRTYKIDVDFAKYYVESEIDRIKAASKGLIPGIERNDILRMSCPLPPIEEQKRIADGISEAFRILDTIDELQSAYSSDLEVLKSKIIDAGIQGKLTEQLPEDGNAEDLYAAIQEEKARLSKEKKIKKSKALPEITEEEIPFEIPDNWKWVRMSEVLDVRDGTHDSPKYHVEGIPMITSKNLSNGALDFSNVKYVSEQDAEKINERSSVDDGDVLFAMIGTIGNPVLVKKEFDFVIKNVALFKPFENTDISMEYIYWYLRREQYVFKRIVTGGLQPFVSLKQFREHVMPLPPLSQQLKIADRLSTIVDSVEMV